MKEKITNLINKFKQKNEENKNIPTKWSASRITVTAIGIVLCIIFVPILISNLVLIIKGAANPDEVPSIFNVSPMIVLSGSMKDTIKKGDLIFVKKIDIDEIKADDIIAFYENEFVVTHRVISVEVAQNGDKTFKTKGDNNISADLIPVLPENIVGIYTKRVGKMGAFAMFLQSPIGMIIFIGSPILLYILFVVLRREIYVRKNINNAPDMPTEIINENEKLKAELQKLKKLAEENEKDKKNEEEKKD